MALKWRYAETGEGWTEYIESVRAADPRIVQLVEAPNDRDRGRSGVMVSV